MALAFDTAASSALVNPGTSVTWLHTCTGADGILFVACFGNNGGAGNISGATYNGVAMTQIGAAVQVPADRWLYLFYLIAPATGAHSVVVSASASIALAGLSASYTGAKQTGQPDANSSSTTIAATSFTLSQTTVAYGCWVVAFFKAGSTPSAGSGLTSRAAAFGMILGDNAMAVAAGATVNETATAASTPWAGIIASVASDSSAPNSAFLAFC
jgi:hypothetical protein